MIDECLVVEIRVDGDGCPLAAATEATAASVEARVPLLRHDGNALLRFSSARPDDDLAATLDADERIRYLHRTVGPDRSTYRCLSLAPCILHDLTDAGLLLESVRYDAGQEFLSGSVVGSTILEGVLEAAGDAVGVTVERIHPLGDGTRGDAASPWDLTPAQEEALRVAHEAGYFGVPKGATAAEVAEHLGISKSAFLERLRRGQSALFDGAFPRR